MRFVEGGKPAYYDSVCVFDSMSVEKQMEEYSDVNMALEKGGRGGRGWGKGGAKVKYDFRLLLCCRMWWLRKGLDREVT